MNDFNLPEEKKVENNEHHAFDTSHKVESVKNEEKKIEIEKPDQEEDDEKFPWLFAIISIFLAGIVAIIIYLAVAPSRAGDETGEIISEDGQVVENVVLPENADEMNMIAGKYYPPYKLRNNYEGKGWAGNQSLLNSKNEVIFASMADIFPELNNENHYLNILGQPQGADFIILEIKNEDQNGKLYKFYIENGERKELSANTIYADAKSKNFLSDNHRQLLMVPANNMTGLEQRIYLISLLNGSYKTLAELTENESFNGGWEYDLDFIQAEWLSAEEISIAIFDQSKKMEKPANVRFPYLPSQEYADEIFIENRTIDIK